LDKYDIREKIKNKTEKKNIKNQISKHQNYPKGASYSNKFCKSNKSKSL